MNNSPLLRVKEVSKTYRQGWRMGGSSFTLSADFEIYTPSVTAILGANGAGKSSLFDLIAGNDTPAFGHILCRGQNIHQVKRNERNKLVRYNRQSQLARHRRSYLPPDFMLGTPHCDEPLVHLFDEPNQEEWMTRIFFNVADKLRASGNAVLFSMHPGKMADIKAMQSICDHFIYAEKGQYTLFDSYANFLAHPSAYQYLKPLFEPSDLNSV